MYKSRLKSYEWLLFVHFFFLGGGRVGHDIIGLDRSAEEYRTELQKHRMAENLCSVKDMLRKPFHVLYF